MSLSIAQLQVTDTAASYSDIQSGTGLGLGYLYYFNNGTDPSGFVFELADLDVSGQIAEDPSFAQVLAQIAGSGLPQCDATLEYTASANDFLGLFSIQVDSSDVDDLSNNDVLFRVNQAQDNTYNDISAGTGSASVGAFFGDLSFSEAQVKSGNVNNYYTGRQQVKYDFVRHLAKQITGGYSSSDIFTNETTLVNGVAALDASLNTALNAKINAAAAADFTHNLSNGFTRAAHGLYHVNTQILSRQTQLLLDVSNASANFNTGTASNPSVRPLNIPLRFYAGDRIAVRIAYHPIAETFSGNGVPISERSYKVLFKLT